MYKRDPIIQHLEHLRQYGARTLKFCIPHLHSYTYRRSFSYMSIAVMYVSRLAIMTQSKYKTILLLVHISPKSLSTRFGFMTNFTNATTFF